MAENNTLNIKFPIYTTENGAQVSFPVGETQLVLRKATYENVMMSFGDKITGDVYYKDNSLVFSMKEYIIYDGVKYRLVNPPTVVRNGVASEASADGALTKYTFEFYHPMYMLANYPFSDIAVTQAENQYLSESKDFSWVGNPVDFVAKINSNLRNTQWKVELGSGFPQTKLTKMSEVLPFKEQTVADAIKTFYDTWEVPFTFESITDAQTEDYQQGKRFKVVFGLPVNEIYATAEDKQQNNPFVFQFGKGVGLKNNSRTPKNNQIVTRLSGCGSENNIPYGYPQIPWRGDKNAKFTYGDHAGLYENVTIGNKTFTKVVSYPLYMGVYEGQWVKLIKHPFARKKLMPSSYRTSLINKVSPYVVFVEDENTHRLVAPQETTVNENYNPDLTLIDYIDAVNVQGETPYPNPIVANDPSYSFHEFEKIKPELNPDRDIATNIDDNEYGEEQFAIVNAYPLTVDGLPAQQWISDLKEDSEEYKQSYFAVTLPILRFDLYACASITEEMQIYMRTGACQGCTFNVKIDWENYKSNFFDGEGNFDPDHARRNTQTYPNSKEQQITLILEKDLQTFGTLMPNEYQNPSVGDEFVILGISLPQTYILDAEHRLDKAMEAYLRENNEYHYEYPLKFDEHFLATHPYILEQLKPNCLLRFMYANEEHHLYVKQMTVKYGDKPLPQYDITLAEDMEVVLNQLGEVQEDVSRIDSALSILQQTYGSNIWLEIAKKLSKTQDDTAQGRIRFLKGLQLGEKFNSGLLGEGGVLRVDADGKTYFEVDKMYARVKAIFDTVEIRKDTHTTGNRIVSNAGMKCTRVVWYDSNDAITDNINNVAYFRCYFRGDDGDKSITNDYQLHDLAYCHETTANNGSVVQRSYWREVVGVGSTIVDEELYIDLGNVNTEQHAQFDIHNADTPMPQDNIIQLGNTQSTERQGAIMEYVNGEDSPSYRVYQGIDGFSLVGKEKVAFGVDSHTHKAFMNVSGDAYIGDPNGSTFVKYEQDNSETHTPLLTIKAKIDAQSSYGDSTLGAVLNNMQAQIDGAIDSWFYAGEPTLNNPPANSWTTNNIKDQHLGDLYYDTNYGYAYRFAYEDSTYKWMPIKDTDVTAALANAAQAQRTADEKCRTYIGATAPQPPYNVGDFWVNATWSGLNGNSQTVSYSNDILKCVTAKGENGSFSIDDWSLASKYTSDEKFDSYIRQILNVGNDASGDALTVASALGSIRGALNNGTLIDGGLMLTSLIGMRQRNADGTYTTWAGMNGEYDNSENSISHEYNGAKGHGIAAWYGGAMADIEDAESYLTTDELAEYNSMTATQKATYLRSNRFAKSLLRFDGSGYLAGGSITWNSDGEVTISNVYSNIGNDTLEWSGETLQGLVNLLEQLPFTLQNGSHLYFDPQASFWHLEVQGKTVATQEWVNKNYITKSFFDSLFQLYNDTTKIDANGTIPSSSKLNIQAMFGFWTEQYISSLGHNPNSGSGGSSSGGIDLVAMWSALNGNTNEQINASHLTNALANYVTSSALASALADYLTSADLDGYATVSALNTLATALSNLASVARSGSYNDLSDKPTIPTIPINVSEFTNDAGYLTQHQSLANYVDKTSAQTITGKKTFKEISFVEYGVQSSANPNAARMFNSADGWGGSAYLQLGGSNSGGNAENAIGFYILNRQWSNIILSLTNAGNFNISGTISEGGTQLSQKYLGVNATASKATQLANTRTFWGQSFNGTQDVSGNMSGVGSLSMNGVLSGARGEIKNWNQLIQNGNFAEPNSVWVGKYYTPTISVANGVMSVSSLGPNQNYGIIDVSDNLPNAGHKYLFIVRIKTTYNNFEIRLDSTGNPFQYIFHTFDSLANWTTISAIATLQYANSKLRLVSGEGVDKSVEFSRVLVSDLTEMFGAGNEPTTANEFARRLGYASIDDVPYIPYTATPTTLNNAVSFGGDLMVQGNKVILANGLVLNYNKSTNTLTFENTDGEPCNIVATGGVTALG